MNVISNKYIWQNFCGNPIIFWLLLRVWSKGFSPRTPDVSVTITSSDLAGVLQGTLSPLQVDNDCDWWSLWNRNSYQHNICHQHRWKPCFFLTRLCRPTWLVGSQPRETSRSWCSLTNSRAVVTNQGRCLTYRTFSRFMPHCEYVHG